jgi:hypothetical protein
MLNHYGCNDYTIDIHIGRPENKNVVFVVEDPKMQRLYYRYTYWKHIKAIAHLARCNDYTIDIHIESVTQEMIIEARRRKIQ